MSARSHPRAGASSSPGSRRATVVGWFRDLPVEALLIGLGLFALLTAFVAADPASRLTFSVSPFTDEAFNCVNARNVVLLGRWSTDEWNLYLVNVPFSVAEAVWFHLVGVGIVQARLIAIACVSLTATTLVWGLKGAVGRAGAVFAGIAFATSGLVLAYGRLAFLEDMVVLGLALGTVVLARDERLTLRWGMVSGACYALAIGAKPSALFAVAGMMLAIGVVLAPRDRAVRRWIAGTVTAIAVAGLVWALAIWLPNQAAVALDLKIWATESISLSPADAVRSAWLYVTSDNDHLYGTLLGPLLGLGAAGLAAIAVFRRRLTCAQARLTLVSIGWLLFGFGILMVASYRPNRYALPLVPPLAIFGAIGMCLVQQFIRAWVSERASPPDAAAAAAAEPRRGTWRWAGRWATPAFAIVIIVATTAPGLAWYASWARHATYNLPAIQDNFAASVPDGERVAGRESALYLMKSKAITMLTQPGGGPANHGDLYVQGVKYYLLPVDDPAPPGVPDAVWAARERIMCAEYGGVTECLFHVR